MLRIIKDKKPKYFVAENVAGILNLGKGAIFKKLLKILKVLVTKLIISF